MEKKANSVQNNNYLFESTENLEVYTSFDAMGLRDDLIKGMSCLNYL